MLVLLFYGFNFLLLMLILTTQIASEMDSEQRKELEHMILELEAENANLKDEYNHLKTVGVGQITLGECTLNELLYSC